MATDVRQLLLQVDASVAVAQRNLGQLAKQVANDSNSMDQALSRVDRAFSRVSKSAEESAQAFLEGDRAAKSLIASIDPLFAAQQRYDRELEKANGLYRAGALSAAEFAKVQTGLKGNLDQSVQAYGRVAGASGSMRAGLQQLSFQVGDVSQGFALGVKPMTIFAQQGGQIIQTFQLMAGSGNKFLSFLGGPWGLAISAAASILLLLTSRHKENAESVDDLVDKMRKQASQARLNEQANAIWANSIEGVIDAQRRLREESERAIGTEVQLNRSRLRQAQDNQNRLREELAAKEREVAALEKRRSEIGANSGTVGGSGTVIGTGAAAANEAQLAKINEKIKATTDRVGELKRAIADGERTIRSAAIPVAQDYADAMSDASRRAAVAFSDLKTRIEIASRDGNVTVTKNLNELEASLAKAEKAAGTAASAGVNVQSATSKVNALTNALIAGKIGPDAYTKSVREMAKSLDAAAKAAQDAKRHTSGLGRASLSDGTSILQGMGATVTSTTRTTAQNKNAGGAANSYHLANGRGFAIDFVPKGGMTAFDKEMYRLAFEAKGLKVLEILGPGDKGHSDHGHIAFAKTRQGPDQIAAAQEARANKAEAERLKGVKIDNTFEERSDQLNSQLLAAKLDLVEDVHLQAAYAKELASAEGDRVKAAIQNDVEEGKLKQAQADSLKATQDKITAQRLQNIAIREQVQSLREQDQTEQQAYEFKVEALRFQDEIAKTQGAQRQLQLEIVDLVYEQKKKHLETLKAQADLAGNIEEAARIQAQINELPAQQARDQYRARENTKGPMEDYFSSVPQTAEEAREAMERLKVQGIDGAINSIIALQDGFESFRDTALSAIKQVIAELIRMQLMKAAMSIFGAGTGAPTFDTATLATASGSGAALPFAGFRASGGPVSRGKAYVVGEKRPELFIPDTSGIIVPQVPRAGVPMGGRGGDTIIINSTAPNSGDPRRDRRSSMQHAAILNEQLATQRRKGIAA